MSLIINDIEVIADNDQPIVFQLDNPLLSYSNIENSFSLSYQIPEIKNRSLFQAMLLMWNQERTVRWPAIIQKNGQSFTDVIYEISDIKDGFILGNLVLFGGVNERFSRPINKLLSEDLIINLGNNRQEIIDEMKVRCTEESEMRFPMIWNPEHFGKTNREFGYFNEELDWYQTGAINYYLHSGTLSFFASNFGNTKGKFAICPWFHLKYIIEQLFIELDFQITGNFLSYPGIDKILIESNLTLDKFENEGVFGFLAENQTARNLPLLDLPDPNWINIKHDLTNKQYDFGDQFDLALDTFTFPAVGEYVVQVRLDVAEYEELQYFIPGGQGNGGIQSDSWRTLPMFRVNVWNGVLNAEGLFQNGLNGHDHVLTGSVGGAFQSVDQPFLNTVSDGGGGIYTFTDTVTITNDQLGVPYWLHIYPPPVLEGGEAHPSYWGMHYPVRMLNSVQMTVGLLDGTFQNDFEGEVVVRDHLPVTTLSELLVSLKQTTGVNITFDPLRRIMNMHIAPSTVNKEQVYWDFPVLDPIISPQVGSNFTFINQATDEVVTESERTIYRNDITKDDQLIWLGWDFVERATRRLYRGVYDEDLNKLVPEFVGYYLPSYLTEIDEEFEDEEIPSAEMVGMEIRILNDEKYMIPSYEKEGSSKYYAVGYNENDKLRLSLWCGMQHMGDETKDYPLASPFGLNYQMERVVPINLAFENNLTSVLEFHKGNLETLRDPEILTFNSEMTTPQVLSLDENKIYIIDQKPCILRSREIIADDDTTNIVKLTFAAYRHTRPKALRSTNKGFVGKDKKLIDTASDKAITTIDTAITFNILTNDSLENPVSELVIHHPTDETIFFDATEDLLLSGQGTFNVALTGEMTFTPATGFLGSVSCFYVVYDDQGSVSSKTKVTVHVVEVIPAGRSYSDDFNQSFS